MEAIGRRFMNMDYQDADMLSRENCEFILSLFPSATIYGTLLPPEARNAIGKVGTKTEPVKRMLESIGFCYTQEVDPFDGGPHYRAPLKNITLVRNMISATIHFDDTLDYTKATMMLVELPNGKNDFRIVKTPVINKAKKIFIPRELETLAPKAHNQLGHAIPF